MFDKNNLISLSLSLDIKSLYKSLSLEKLCRVKN